MTKTYLEETATVILGAKSPEGPKTENNCDSKQCNNIKPFNNQLNKTFKRTDLFTSVLLFYRLLH